MAGIPNDLFCPCLPDLGINFSCLPTHSNFFFSTASLISNIRFFVGVSIVCIYGPGVDDDPLLRLILRYAANQKLSSLIRPLRSWKVFNRF